ncbi:hypothetical protein BKA56DRAFT_673100 [Ilyonectria sp. MPI-CAGE-AT-0026]|nr:hypothetical protein BKA56DRAFT_673100 [Ilyonectria sp. MPI-CAGE-AT-0026]
MPSTAAPLHVLIVGAGITGLTAAIACRQKGFSVTALEASLEFSHVGAGVFPGGNATRILCEMDLQDALEKCAVHLRTNIFRNQDGSKTLSVRDYSNLEREIGYPLVQMHRADLHDVLLQQAKDVGVVIKMGFLFEADVILAADGYRSFARESLLGRPDEPRPSGNAAYRALIPIEKLHRVPELKEFLDWKTQTNFVWIGQGKHVVAYLLRQGTVYNVVLTGPAQKTIGSKYVVKADVTEVLEQYKDWDPCLVKVLKELPDDSTLEWRLCDMEPMDSWVFPGGKIALMGDACHAVLPSAAQGAGMGMEDGVAVAEFLARTESISQIPQAIKAYQELRLPRCEAIMTDARGDAKKWQGRSGAPPKAGVTSEWSWEYDVKRAARESPLEG